MAQKFKTGDTVELKSGGPEMTVREYYSNIDVNLNANESETEVICEWFDDKNQPQSKTFHQDTLNIVE